MNKIMKLCTSIFVIVMFYSCNQDIDRFDNADNYIYFNMPFVLNQYGKETSVRQDSLSYSFALDDISVTSYVFKIPINTVGLAHSQERTYRVEVVADSSNVTDADWDKSCIENLTVKRDSLRDTLYVKVFRSEKIRSQWCHIVFRLLPNENFQLGDEKLLTAKISFSDILTPPDWWNKWQGVFGDFCREKFVKWQEIYYLGADPNVDTIGGPGLGKPLYWDNMPYYAMSSWYPSTFMFVRIMKQYFIDNEVYPDGDTSKPRVLLP